MKFAFAALAILIAGFPLSAQQTPQQQKAAQDYCLAHPLDATKCYPPIPPDVLPDQPNGVPAMPKPQPRTKGFVLPGQPPSDDPQKVIDDFNAKAAKDEADMKAKHAPKPVQPLTMPSAQQQIDEQNRQNAIRQQQLKQQIENDRIQLEQQQQERRQQNYEAGRQLGAGAGTLVGALIYRHRIRSYCKKHPGDSWRFPNGSVYACGGQAPQTGPSAYDLEAANHAKLEMDGIRASLANIESWKSDAPYIPEVLSKGRASWASYRDTYCAIYRNGDYTGLDGTEQTCGR